MANAITWDVLNGAIVGGATLGVLCGAVGHCADVCIPCCYGLEIELEASRIYSQRGAIIGLIGGALTSKVGKPTDRNMANNH